MKSNNYRVILYGLCEKTFFIEKALMPEYNIIGYSDSFAEIEEYNNKPFYIVSKLIDVEFEYIIVCLGNRKTFSEIKNVLLKAGIKSNKILDIVALLKRQKIDAIMDKTVSSGYDGIVLGCSHAAWGINSYLLMGNCCNLAVNGEDIYYHYCVLRKAYDIYYSRICNLKYAVIDLWDYPVFNVDLSMSSGLLYYFNSYGFMEDLHNYDKNSLFKMDVNSEMEKRNFYSPLQAEKDKSLADSMFNMNYVKKNYDRFFRIYSLGSLKPAKSSLYWEYRVEDEYDTGIPENVMFPHHGHLACIKRYYKETNKENEAIICCMCELLKQINPDLKIFITLIPRYISIEDFHRDNVRLKEYEIAFLHKMKSLKREYGIKLLDFKNNRKLSSNPHFYRDEDHFNSFGANAFTSVLRREIEKELTNTSEFGSQMDKR